MAKKLENRVAEVIMLAVIAMVIIMGV